MLDDPFRLITILRQVSTVDMYMVKRLPWDFSFLTSSFAVFSLSQVREPHMRLSDLPYCIVRIWCKTANKVLDKGAEYHEFTTAKMERRLTVPTYRQLCLSTFNKLHGPVGDSKIPTFPFSIQSKTACIKSTWIE
jgi:hypothetical protein